MTPASHAAPFPRRLPDVLRWCALLAFQAGALAGVLRIGHRPVPWRDLVGWVDTTAGVDVAIGLLRPVALALAGYLLVTTTLYAVARASGAVAATRCLAPATVPLARRLTDRAVAVALFGSVVGGPVVGVPVAAVAAPLPPGLQAPTGVEDPPERSASPVEPARAQPRERTRLVEAGEHLWSIAAAELASRTGRPVTALSPSEIGPYWAELVATNRYRIRSQDPDLVLPGERLVLPPGPEEETGR